MMNPDPTDRPRAVLERDAALARAGRARRWVIGGTAALTAGSAALVSAIAPGRSLGAKPLSVKTPVTTANTAAPQLPPLASPSSLGLGAPSAAPEPAPQSNPSPSQAQQQSPPAQQSSPAPQDQAPAPSSGGPVVSGGS
jgi:hypothetical protein